MFGALGDLPIPLCIAAWSMAGFGIGMAYSPLSVTVLGLAEPGTEGVASSSIQLADVLGVALGTGLGGAFVALGESQGWATSSALAFAFPHHLRRRRRRHLRGPHASPRPSPADPAHGTGTRRAPIALDGATRSAARSRVGRFGRCRASGELLVDDVDEALAGLDGAEVLALHGHAGGEEGGAAGGEPGPRGERRR